MTKSELLDWLERLRQYEMEIQAERNEGWDAEDEAAYKDLVYYLNTSGSVVKETEQGTELMRLFGKPWVDQSDPQRIELLRACVRLLALALASGQEYFLQQVVEKLSPEGK